MLTEKILTCIECPMGCEIKVEVDNNEVVSIKGNTCPRGKIYAQNEVICPKRVLTTTVRLKSGEMVAVKTSLPVNKSHTIELMKKINSLHPEGPVTVGDVLVKNIIDDADLIVTSPN